MRSRMPLQAEHDGQSNTKAIKNAASFVDQRPAALAQRRTKEQMDNSAHGARYRALSEMAGNSPRALQKMHSPNGHGTVQMAKWTMVGDKFKIYLGPGNHRAPLDNEEMDHAPPGGKMRENEVWDDVNQTFLGADGLPVNRDESQSPVLNFTSAPYEEASGSKVYFGHRFSFSVWMKGAKSIKWLEKTNRPYLEEFGMAKDEWFDLYENFKDNSPVFQSARPLSDSYQRYLFNDPPAAYKEANQDRTLEFDITLETKQGESVGVKAKQVLRTDAEGNITTQTFEHSAS
jgi:hypothetical protein